MTVDTHVSGNPGSVRVAAGWLRDQFASNIDVTGEKMYSIRNTLDSAWDGPASRLACEKMTHGAQRTAEMAAAARSYASAIDAFASELQNAHDRMADVRTDAAAAGLTLSGDVILDPGSDSEAHRLAYEAASHGADAARQIETLAGETLKNVWLEVTERWFLIASDLLGGAAESLASKHVSLLTKRADVLAEEAAKYLRLAQSAPPGTPAAQIYRDVDESRAALRRSEKFRDVADKIETRAGRFFAGLGGALAVGGIAYDIYEGKPVDQAIVSGGLGFGAAVAAGALIGTAIPVPGVGTLVGAAGGAIVGIFISGAVDTLYTEGLGSVGDAIGDGAAAVADTGSAIGELATRAWDAIF
ncbi:hypothetical protein QM797_14715 [Rhodococcus sp. IEGM 1381]|uniref:hypothetical protein n=1 Tax=Rhodococcus sp. IEGM 1381 TaxID=3047085 RepID=UPI0024B63825|nr:hypothetical protein [Rhodococcus sp. IEGM 1381]MDI9895975.1 hypothetical protein [Rhodococcus sp. IEGM 1381]